MEYFRIFGSPTQHKIVKPFDRQHKSSLFRMMTNGEYERNNNQNNKATNIREKKKKRKEKNWSLSKKIKTLDDYGTT